MRSVQLQEALTAYVESAAAHLQAEVDAGAEVPFELERRGARRHPGGPSLYCYQPLTDRFISERMPALQQLDGYAHAAQCLHGFDGVARYLAAAGGQISAARAPSEAAAAIQALLCDVFAGQSDFHASPERVGGAIARLQNAAQTATSEVTLVARLSGLTIVSPEIPLTSGLTIAQPHALADLPSAAVDGAPGGHLVVVLAVEGEQPRDAVEHGRAILDELLRALRLFGDGRVTLGALGWARVGGGQWTALALGAGGRPRGMLVVTPEQEDELRAFCNLVSRRAPDGNDLAWALRRFELGCERAGALEALSDHLLALRALLEPEGPASGLLAGRIAALCATPQRRLHMTERMVHALALERAAIAGTAREHAASEALVADVADHLRALLRDVICGHLDADLVSLADEILLEAQEEPEPRATPVPAQPQPVRERPAGELAEEVFGHDGEPQQVLDVFI